MRTRLEVVNELNRLQAEEYKTFGDMADTLLSEAAMYLESDAVTIGGELERAAVGGADHDKIRALGVIVSNVIQDLPKDAICLISHDSVCLAYTPHTMHDIAKKIPDPCEFRFLAHKVMF